MMTLFEESGTSFNPSLRPNLTQNKYLFRRKMGHL